MPPGDSHRVSTFSELQTVHFVDCAVQKQTSERASTGRVECCSSVGIDNTMSSIARQAPALSQMKALVGSGRIAVDNAGRLMTVVGFFAAFVLSNLGG